MDKAGGALCPGKRLNVPNPGLMLGYYKIRDTQSE